MLPRRPVVPTVDVGEAYRRLAAADGPRPLLVDVREPDEFVRVRAAGAILVPLGSLPHRLLDLPRDRPILLICATGNRSASATAYLLAAGFEDVANVEGGTVAWYRAGLPWRSGPPEDGEELA